MDSQGAKVPSATRRTLASNGYCTFIERTTSAFGETPPNFRLSVSVLKPRKALPGTVRTSTEAGISCNSEQRGQEKKIETPKRRITRIKKRAAFLRDNTNIFLPGIYQGPPLLPG